MKKLLKSFARTARHRHADDGDLQRPVQSLTSDHLRLVDDLRTFADSHDRNGLRPVPLSTLERPNDQKHYDIDVVAVHGLGGDFYKTWTSEGEGDPSHHIYWLSHLLPHDLPGARIFSFGYNSGIAFSRSVAGMKEYAKLLLLDLLQCQESCRQRPIIFICHSLGGIVVKQAIVLAHENNQFSQVLHNVRAIMFMGTPHRGSGIAAAAKPLSKLINLSLLLSGASTVTGVMRTDLFKLLSHESTQLGDINESFIHRLENIVILSCFETEVPRGLQQLVVKQSSAILGIPHEQEIPVSADHMRMCRFASSSEAKYKNVSSALLRTAQAIVDSKQDPISGTEGPKSPNQSLSDSELRYVSRFKEIFSGAIGDRVKGTCTWSAQSEPYRDWIQDNHSTILWITGDAGCGKTTLTFYLVETLSRQLESAMIRDFTIPLVCYFFCSRNAQTPADACSILRGLIVQLLVSSKDVVKQVRAKFSTAKQMFDQSYESLWKIFSYAAHMVQCNVLYIIVDALDECEEKSREKLLRSVSQILELYNQPKDSPGKRIKFLATGQPHMIRVWSATEDQSRHYHLNMESRPQAMVEDVINFINKKVDELVAIGICTNVFAQDLRQSLHQLAGNSFLWASVVLEQCRISLELIPESLPQLLSVLPIDLKEAYARYLPRVPHQSVALLQKYVQLLVVCKRPLKLEETTICLFIENCHRVDDIHKTQNTAIESSLRRAFGPLVRIWQNQIFFAHTTVRDYLVDIGADTSHPLHGSHGVNTRAAHLTFAVACMKYLFLENFRGDLFDIQDPQTDRSLSSTGMNNSDESSLYSVHDMADLFGIHDVAFLKDEDSIRKTSAAKIEAHFDFYDYAATNWTYHYACSEDLAPEEVMRQAIELSKTGSTHFTNWYNYVVARSRTSMPEVSQVDSVTVAALFNHPKTLRYLLSHASGEIAKGHIAALFWAASKGHPDAVRILIEYDIDPNQTQNGQTPLAIAVQAGYFDVCTTLLSYGRTDPNLTERRGRAPLSLAAAYNHRDILGILLAQERIEVSRVDALGRTAFTEAAINGSLDCLQNLLLDGRSSINHQDSKGQDALIHAVRNGFYSISKLLLKSPGLKLDLVDARQRNAMSHAAEAGDLRIVQQLWRRGISISDQDCDGRNAISWAANSASATNIDLDRRCALKFLVESSRKSADVMDCNGWTPLAWAMETPGYLTAVEILIEDGQVNVNQVDNTRGRPVLSWATSEGFLEITKFLLKTVGIEKNRIDHEGRTPLSYAAGSGRLDVVNLLAEDAEVALDTRDSLGRTPLDWAVLGQHDSVAQTIQHLLQIRSTYGSSF